MYENVVGKTLRTLRIERQLSQGVTVRGVMSVRHYIDIEAGRCSITMNALLGIMKNMRATLTDFWSAIPAADKTQLRHFKPATLASTLAYLDSIPTFFDYDLALITPILPQSPPPALLKALQSLLKRREKLDLTPSQNSELLTLAIHIATQLAVQHDRKTAIKLIRQLQTWSNLDRDHLSALAYFEYRLLLSCLNPKAPLTPPAVIKAALLLGDGQLANYLEQLWQRLQK